MINLVFIKVQKLHIEPNKVTQWKFQIDYLPCNINPSLGLSSIGEVSIYRTPRNKKAPPNGSALKWAQQGSNLGPPDYESGALTN